MAGETSAVAIVEDVPVERLWLDDRSWVDVARGWVRGDGELYELLVAEAGFGPSRVFRYDHWVDEPRLGAGWRPDRSPHPVLVEAHRQLQHRYRVRFEGAGLAWYRDGRDSVAFHRDRELMFLDDTVIALLVLGAHRPFLLRPRRNRHAHHLDDGGAVHDLRPGAGDLVVMGGAAQVGWEHAVPKVPAPVGGRISVQWRWTSRTGRPERGGSYRAPRRFGRG